jgi:addiction module HigA family antidote
MERKKTSRLGSVILSETSGRPCDFARNLGISKTHLNYLIRGDRRITWKVARRLGELTKRSAREWLALQANADLAEGEGQADADLGRG